MTPSTPRHPESFPHARRLVLVALAGISLWTLVLQAAPRDAAPLASESQPVRPQADLFRKRPHLIYRGDPTQMQVLWQLTATESGTVQWGVDETYSGGSAQTEEYGSDHQHRQTLEGLTPGQRYFYRVTVQDVSYGGSFNAAPPLSATRAKLLAYGDTRSNPDIHDQVAARMIATWNADNTHQSVVLSVGDIVGNGETEEDWTDELFNPTYANILQVLSHVPLQASIGNHEGDGVLFNKYFPYPYVDARYWSFDYGPAHVVILDQYEDYSPGSSQYHWLENDLANTNRPWKFIVLHAPGWTAGGGHENEPGVQDYVQPLCEEHDVSIVFGGHNHYYARALVGDVHHVTTGGGGAPLYSPDTSEPNIVAAVRANHFCVIDIDGPVLRFRAIRSSGAVLDSFTLRRPPTPVTLSDITAAAGSDYVNLRWSASLEEPATFQVLRSSQADGDDAPVSELLHGTPGHHDFAWRDGSVRVATEYYYKVRWRETAEWSYSRAVRVMTGAATFGIRRIAPLPLGRGPSRIDFELAQSGRARLEVFDVTGNNLCTLVDAVIEAGVRAVTWDGRGRDGRALPAGVYFARLTAHGAASTRKVVLVR